MGKTSSVWNHAKRVDSDTAKCNLCEEALSAKGGNTSTIKRHLAAVHKVDVDKSSAAPPSITTFLVPSKAKVLSKARSVEIDRRIASFIARAGRPIRTAEGDGFRELLKYLEPQYIIKSRPTTTAQIKAIYQWCHVSKEQTGKHEICGIHHRYVDVCAKHCLYVHDRSLGDL